MEDSRGVTRGACNLCGCIQYHPPSSTDTGSSWKCTGCGHFPTKHQKLGARKTCLIPGCYQPLQFDLNTGRERDCCSQHEAYQDNISTSSAVPVSYTENQIMQLQDIEYDCYYGDTLPMPITQQPPLYDPYSDGYQTSSVYVTDGVQMQDEQPFLYIPTPQVESQIDHTQFGLPMVPAVQQIVQCLVPGMQKCAITECPNPCYIDDSGKVHNCCGKTHAKEFEQRQSQSTVCGAIQPPIVSSNPGQPTIVGHGQAAAVGPGPGQPPAVRSTLPSGISKCAITECQNPCFIDEAGTVHECCGITHAMEHQRRKAIEQQKQVIKGTTHCLLPECNQLVWPFKNYCGKSHADIGQQRGLAPPAPPADPNAPKDSSLCIIPGCTSKKYADPSGVTHAYCGKTHAELGKKKNILPTADKKEEECDLPGCQAPKRKEGTCVYDYCCAGHAKQDAPNRDARILNDMTAVKKFLDGFNKLKGYTITENPQAKPPGGTLFRRFKQKWDSLPKSERVTCLAFHGTTDKNISSICQNGYDPKLRSGQAHGAGEYFATTPDISLSYCKGGKRMLLNELLLGKQGTHHTKHNTIIVMKDPAHDLPRFIVTFK